MVTDKISNKNKYNNTSIELRTNLYLYAFIVSIIPETNYLFNISKHLPGLLTNAVRRSSKLGFNKKAA